MRKNILSIVLVIVMVAALMLSITGCGSSDLKAENEALKAQVEELTQRINDAQADFIWVAIGAPRQEILMHRLKGKVNGLMTGVGGAFNILAGRVSDAPMWMQNAGLEWLYRLIKEPRRLFKRYLVTNSKFIWYLIKK